MILIHIIHTSRKLYRAKTNIKKISFEENLRGFMLKTPSLQSLGNITCLRIFLRKMNNLFSLTTKITTC